MRLLVRTLTIKQDQRVSQRSVGKGSGSGHGCGCRAWCEVSKTRSRRKKLESQSRREEGKRRQFRRFQTRARTGTSTPVFCLQTILAQLKQHTLVDLLGRILLQSLYQLMSLPYCSATTAADREVVEATSILRLLHPSPAGWAILSSRITGRAPSGFSLCLRDTSLYDRWSCCH